MFAEFGADGQAVTGAGGLTLEAGDLQFFFVGCHLGRLIPAKLREIAPREEPGIVTIIEVQAHCIIADGISLHDEDIAFAPHQRFLTGAVAFDFGGGAFDAEEFGGDQQVFAGVQAHFKIAAMILDAKFGGPDVVHVSSSRASSANMMGMPSRMG